MRQLSMSVREHISDLGFRFSGKDKSSRCRNRDHLRRSLVLERMEDRRLLTTVDLALLLQDDGTMIFGADTGDYAGTVGSAGDLNGDGYDDFLIAASHGDGLGNLKPNAGEIYIVFGGPSKPATIDLANLESAGITIFGPNENARLYSGSSAGDLNGDGYDDLVLGHGGPPDNFGAVYVIFGGPSLRNRQTIDLASSGAADVIIGGVDYLVGGRGAGDVNGDGFADLILGAGDGDGGGKSYLIFGGLSLPPNIDLAKPFAGVTYYGANGSGNYRVSGADDVNGDEYDDFLISSMFGPDVYLIYGSSSLAENALVDLSNLGPAGVTIRSASVGRGWDAAGDFNGDGYGDLVVVSGWNAADYVIYGGESLPPFIEVESLGTAGVKFTGGGNIEAVGIGDVNGDGIDDLLLAGAYSATELGYTYLVFGSPTMEPTIDLTNLGNAGVAFKSIDLTDGRPRVSRAGDVNGDGFDDFLIGVENGDGPNNSRVDAGESYLIYGGLDFPGVHFPPTKFFVVNDGSPDRTYEYGETGIAVENYSLGSGNTAPRGAASNLAGDKVWVVDANKKVYVYDDAGGLLGLGPWTANSLASNATVEGIATDGTHVWIVDARQDRVYRYDNAASLLSGSQSATSSFALNSGNRSPKDIVTDGTHLWVVNDSRTDMVFKYTLTGSLVGSWTINAGGGSPTGITLDPSGASQSLWIVDSGTDRVYEYSNARGLSSGSLAASASFALAAGNTNPQGIAHHPPPSSAQLPLATASQAPAALLLAADFDESLPPVTAFDGAVLRTSDSRRDERALRVDLALVMPGSPKLRLSDSNVSAIPPVVRSEPVARASEGDEREAFDKALLDVLAEAELARYASVFEN